MGHLHELSRCHRCAMHRSAQSCYISLVLYILRGGLRIWGALRARLKQSNRMYLCSLHHVFLLKFLVN
jgi:hypothetical protein